jgi:hypothetical protein
MLTPGEINRGQWVMFHSFINPEPNDMPEMENPLAGLFMTQTQSQYVEPPIEFPHLVTAVSLPFVVVIDCSQSPCISKIWRADEMNLLEVSEDFVSSWSPSSLARGQQLLKINEVKA